LPAVFSGRPETAGEARRLNEVKTQYDAAPRRALPLFAEISTIFFVKKGTNRAASLSVIWRYAI
jgi:hypothetical protein